MLDPLLITRVPETTGSKKARQHITDTLGNYSEIIVIYKTIIFVSKKTASLIRSNYLFVTTLMITGKVSGRSEINCLNKGVKFLPQTLIF